MKAEEWFKHMHQVVDNVAAVTGKKKPEKEIELDAIRGWEQRKDKEEDKIRRLQAEQRLKTEKSSH